MYAKVIVDISNSQVDRTFEYSVPDGISVAVGQRVYVPFAGKRVEGIVLELSDICEYDIDKIKPLTGTIEDFSAVTPEQLRLASKIRERYHTPLASALRLMFPNSLRGGKAGVKKVRYASLSGDIEAAFLSVKKADGSVKYKKQYELLCCLKDSTEIRTAELDNSALRSLEKKGFISITEKEVTRNAFDTDVSAVPEPELTDTQKYVFSEILRDGRNILLHGVTGSGKTEIYVRVIKHMLESGKTAIILVPEISLTPQIYRFLASRVNTGIAVFHSGLSDGERFDEWLKVKRGKAKVVLGARSAVFAPLDNIGAIIIDEEHESSYKADNYPKYTAHEIAHLRCAYFGAKLILGSATPSVGTYYAALSGEYRLLEMPERMFGLEMPEVLIVDMKEELRNGNRSVVSSVLSEKLEAVSASGKQAMLFLNRRGYSTFVMCRACGYVVKCDACDVTMTYHKKDDTLKCHYCGRVKKVSYVCPECGKPYLKYFGTGTQQVEETVMKMFPKARVMRADLDSMSRKDAHFEVFESFFNHKADILVGTQMITKGFDFKDVSLSAVLAADTMLNFPDYRSAEYTFMHITQIAGRAGRKEKGEVVLQTYNPSHYAVESASRHDYRAFYEKEIKIREARCLPPFSYIIRIQFSGKKKDFVVTAVKGFLKKLSDETKGCREDILRINAGESAVRRINELSRYEIFLCLKKHCEHDTINIVKKIFSREAYDGVLIGLDIE